MSRPVTLLFLLLGLLASPATHPTWAEDAKTVSLTVDYGDGVLKRFTAIEWSDSMTIADVLAFAAKHPRGIKFEKRGSGSTALLLQIDDVKNGTGDRYWIYEVNGKEGDRSYALVKLAAGDSILWKFAKYQ